MSVVVLADAIAGSVSVRRSIESLKNERNSWRQNITNVVTNHELTNAAIDRALNDVHMLMSNKGSGAYVSAGVPWFDTLFGRDSIISAMMMLPFTTDLAAGTLRALAGLQGSEFDAAREEEPGKILHEMRTCETSGTGEVPFQRYYGSIDSTPLFVLLASEYFRWTGDIGLLNELMPSLKAALEWIDKLGDRDGDGFLEYQKRTPQGLDNQGWKDSHDGIIDAAGKILTTPIALVEVQGYVYAAKLGIAEVFEQLGEGALAARLRSDADTLRSRISDAYWLERGYFGMALDRDKQLSTAVASNGGHLLWSGVPNPRQAKAQADRLFREDMFTGWGIRTLSSGTRRFNPLGYHLGTVWPHENALIVAGLHRYGLGMEAQILVDTLIQAALNFPGLRLPELFSGASKLAHHGPVPYPVACRPQAWAASSLPFSIISLLGLEPNTSLGILTLVRPHLPSDVNHLQVKNLIVGSSTVSFDLRRQGKRITAKKAGRSPIRIAIRE